MGPAAEIFVVGVVLASKATIVMVWSRRACCRQHDGRPIQKSAWAYSFISVVRLALGLCAVPRKCVPKHCRPPQLTRTSCCSSTHIERVFVFSRTSRRHLFFDITLLAFSHWRHTILHILTYGVPVSLILVDTTCVSVVASHVQGSAC